MSSESRAPEERKLKVFVSYSRRDLAFADRLAAALEAREIEILIDRRSLPALEDWERELLGLIRQSDTVLFILSAHSASSRTCSWELEQVRAHSKRLAPVALADVQGLPVPAEIARLNCLFFTDESLFEQRADELARALKTDLAWIKEHTRLGESALRWAEREKPEDALLRGRDLDEADAWVSHHPREAPRVSELHLEFLAASRAAQGERQQREREQIERTRRFQRRAGWGLGGIALLTGVGAIAGMMQARATSETESRVFASLARRAFDSRDCILGTRYALSGLPPPGATPISFRSAEVERLLRHGVSTCPRIGEVHGHANDAMIMPGADVALFDGVGNDDRWRALWSLRPAKFLAQLGADENRNGDYVFFPNLPRFGLVQGDAFRFFSTKDGKVLSRIDGVYSQKKDRYGGEDTSSVAASRDGRQVAIGATAEPVRVFAADSGREVVRFGPLDLEVYAFSPDGRRVLAGTDSLPQQVGIWDARTGAKLQEAASTTDPKGGAFSPDGLQVAIWGQQGAELWRPGHGPPVKFSDLARSAAVDPGEPVRSIVFDQPGKRALIVGMYKTHIWDCERQKLLGTVKEYLLSHVIIFPDGRRFLGDAYGSSESGPFLGIWRMAGGRPLAKFPTQGRVASTGLSRDGGYAATGTESSVAEVWDLEWMRFSGDAERLQSHLCDRHFLSASPYSAKELSDPILRRRKILAAPCDRHGPLALAFWSRLLGR